MAAPRSLADLRRAIDATDDELLELLNRRARFVTDVAEAKAAEALATTRVA
jgi:chorismate mutase